LKSTCDFLARFTADSKTAAFFVNSDARKLLVLSDCHPINPTIIVAKISAAVRTDSRTAMFRLEKFKVFSRQVIGKAGKRYWSRQLAR
jgi:hypothetical protein